MVCNSWSIIATDDYEDSTRGFSVGQITRVISAVELRRRGGRRESFIKSRAGPANFLNDVVRDGNGLSARRKLMCAPASEPPANVRAGLCGRSRVNF